MSYYLITISESYTRDIQVNTNLLVDKNDFSNSEEYSKVLEAWNDNWKDYNGEVVVGVYEDETGLKAIEQAKEYMNSDVEDMFKYYKLKEYAFHGYFNENEKTLGKHTCEEVELLNECEYDEDVAKLGYTCKGHLISYYEYANNSERLYVWTKEKENKVFIIVTADLGNTACSICFVDLPINALLN